MALHFSRYGWMVVKCGWCVSWLWCLLMVFSLLVRCPRARAWRRDFGQKWSGVVGLQFNNPLILGNFQAPAAFCSQLFLGHPVNHKLHWRRGRFWEASRWGRMLGWPSGLWSWGSSVWSICTLIAQAGHGCQDEAESGYLQRQSPSGSVAPAFYVQSSTTTAGAGISGVSVFLPLRTSFVLFDLKF